jgi:hypothetical protein
MATPSTPIATTPKRRVVMTPRRWATLSAICFLFAAYYVCYEHFPVYVIKDTPLYRATRNGKQGIVTTGGRIVVPFEWDEIGTFDDAGMAHVVLRQPPIHLNTSDPMAGESVDQSYHGVISCNGKVIIPATLTNSSWRFDDRDELQGVREGQLINFDRFGKEKWRSDWLPADQFQCRFGKNGLMAVQKGDETSWIDRTGKVVLRPPEGLRAVSNFDTCGLAKVEDSAGLVGCVDEQGNTVIVPEWNDIYAITRFRTSNERWIEEPPAFITVATEVIQPAMVIKGAFTSSGHQLIPAEHISLDPHYPSQLIIARRVDGKCGCFDFGGVVRVPFQYEDLFPCGDTLFGAKQGGKYGCINARGKIVVPFSLDEISRWARYGDFKLVFASTDGKWGALDFRGNVVLPFEFSDFVTPHHGKYFVGRAVDGCHLFDASGNAIQNRIGKKTLVS